MPLVMLGFCEHLALPLAGELGTEARVEVHDLLLPVRSGPGGWLLPRGECLRGHLPS